MTWDASSPPPPAPFIVLTMRRDGKFKVRAYHHDRIMTREQVLRYAQGAGGQVDLGHYFRPEEIAQVRS